MSKVRSIQQAVRLIQDGMQVGIGEFSYQNPPMTVVREIIKQKKKNLTIISGPTSGLATDMLIGAGCVRKVVTACVAFEQVAGIAPAFRQACEQGKLQVWECDECIWQLGLQASAWGMPFMLWQGGVGSDIPKLNPDLRLVQVDAHGNVRAASGKRQQHKQGTQSLVYVQIPAIRPDITFIHAAAGDAAGTVQYPRQRYLGRTFNEALLARATHGPVIATVERLISAEQTQKHPELTVLRDAMVIEAVDGARPGGCNGVYPPDLEAYRAYVRTCLNKRKVKHNDA